MTGISVNLARYRFTAVMRTGVSLPGYAGSLLRGQFGASLRLVSCMTRQPTCSGCTLLATCPYTRVFEAAPPPAHELQKFSNIPNAYVIEPTPPGPDLAASELDAGSELVFHMVLVGQALEQLPLIVFAWQRALAQGLGRERAQADLRSVEWIDASGLAHSIWQTSVPLLQEHDPVLHVPTMASAGLGASLSLTLNFHTPLRLQHQGQPLHPHQLTPRTLVAALARRAALVMEFHDGQTQWGAQVPGVVQVAESLRDEIALRWHDWTRYSSRQHQEMTLGGVLGRWTLHGSQEVLASIWPWLWLGQWLHAGKNATMGLGGYCLQSGA